MTEYLAKCFCEWYNIRLAQLNNSQQASHGIQVLALVEEFADVLKQFAEDFLAHVSFIEDVLRWVCPRLTNKEFLDAGSCVGLIDWHFRLEILREKIDEVGDKVVWNLVAEHVDKFDASCFENGPTVNLDSLLNL